MPENLKPKPQSYPLAKPQIVRENATVERKANPRPEYSKRLRSILEKSGMTQTELAQLLDVQQSAVSFWIREGKLPHKNTLVKLSAYFGVRSEWLLHGHGPKFMKGDEEVESSKNIPPDLRADLAYLAIAAQQDPNLRDIVNRLARIASRK